MHGISEADRVVAGLSSWQPPADPRRSTCVESVYDFIRERFPEQIVSRQAFAGQVPADILVKFRQGGTLAIEIKADLRDVNECYQLVGELFEHALRGDAQLVILLCGSYDVALVNRVRQAAAHVSHCLAARVELLSKGSAQDGVVRG
jgi:hypothetical protein